MSKNENGMTAEEFIKKHQTRQKESKIAPFLADIIEIRKAGLSYNDILDFLRANNVVISYAALSVYLRRHAPPELLPPQKEPSVKSNLMKKKDTNPVPTAVKEPSTAPDYFQKKRKPEVNLNEMQED